MAIAGAATPGEASTRSTSFSPRPTVAIWVATSSTGAPSSIIDRSAANSSSTWRVSPSSRIRSGISVYSK